MSLRHALLGALADQPLTGYALLKHFEQSLGQAWPASHSQIYPELARLRGDGLIRETAAGARGFGRTADRCRSGGGRRWLRETEPDRRVRSDAALRVFFLWLLEPAEARAFLERERAYLQDRLQRYERIRAEDPVCGRGSSAPSGSRSKEASARWRRGSRGSTGRRGEVASPAWAERDEAAATS